MLETSLAEFGHWVVVSNSPHIVLISTYWANPCRGRPSVWFGVGSCSGMFDRSWPGFDRRAMCTTFGTLPLSLSDFLSKFVHGPGSETRVSPSQRTPRGQAYTRTQTSMLERAWAVSKHRAKMAAQGQPRCETAPPSMNLNKRVGPVGMVRRDRPGRATKTCNFWMP